MFEINTSVVGDSLGLTALVAILPLVAFFIMLMGFKARAHTSGAVALATSIILAIVAFAMPVDMALSSAVRGGLFGLLPIVWVIITAIWFYEITVASGRFEDLRKTFDLLGDGDIRIQSMLIAFCFGGLLEALAGFGAPVAISASAMAVVRCSFMSFLPNGPFGPVFTPSERPPRRRSVTGPVPPSPGLLQTPARQD